MAVPGTSPSDGDGSDVTTAFTRRRLGIEPCPDEVPGVLPVQRFLSRCLGDVTVVLVSVHASSTGLRSDVMARSGPGHPLVPMHARLAERTGVPAVSPPRGST